MRAGAVMVLAGLAISMCLSQEARADAPTTQPATTSVFAKPVFLTLQPDVPSVYNPPSAPREDEGFNEGGVHVRLDFNYMSDFVYRGLDISDGSGLNSGTTNFGHEDAPNLQFDGTISWDLGKLPHPYVKLFVNVDDADPESRFQAVFPTVGFEWTVRPIIVNAGLNTYLYPERDELNTSELFVKLTLDDSYFFRTSKPIFSPYYFAAYDYDLYKGWYMEVGVKHDFEIEDTGVTLTPLADVAYVIADQLYATSPGGPDSGFQHYDLGLVASASLNTIFHASTRYGNFSLKGYLFYTNGIQNDLKADTQLWGGCGITFEY